MTIDGLTRREWRTVASHVRPTMTNKEFGVLWEWIARRKRHKRRSAGLLILKIQAGSDPKQGLDSDGTNPYRFV